MLTHEEEMRIIAKVLDGDTNAFDISGEELDYSSAKTRKVLGEILEKAKAETGFNAYHDRLYIQVFPSLDGGCEMFFIKRTRLLPEPERGHSSCLGKKYTHSFDNIREYGRYIAHSESIENIISLCLRLKNEGFSGKSQLYSLKNDYILMLDFRKQYPRFTKITDNSEDFSSFSFICDYAEIRYADALPSAYIEEHGKAVIKDDAVETIWEHFGEE